MSADAARMSACATCKKCGIALLLASWLFAATLPSDPAAVLVVSESGVEAYAEALDGIGSAFAAPELRVVDLQAATGARDLALALESKETRAVIAVGSRALDDVRARHAAVPVVAAMVLHGAQAPKADGHVDLDVPLAAQLGAMRALWPGRTRAGIIRNPALSTRWRPAPARKAFSPSSSIATSPPTCSRLSPRSRAKSIS
jgi:hypothetical protein